MFDTRTQKAGSDSHSLKLHDMTLYPKKMLQKCTKNCITNGTRRLGGKLGSISCSVPKKLQRYKKDLVQCLTQIGQCFPRDQSNRFKNWFFIVVTPLLLLILIITPIIMFRVSQLGVSKWGTNGFRATHKSGKNEHPPLHTSHFVHFEHSFFEQNKRANQKTTKWTHEDKLYDLQHLIVNKRCEENCRIGNKCGNHILCGLYPIISEYLIVRMSGFHSSFRLCDSAVKSFSADGNQSEFSFSRPNSVPAFPWQATSRVSGNAWTPGLFWRWQCLHSTMLRQ